MNRLIYILALLTWHSVCVWAQGGATLEWGSPISYGDFESKPVETDTAAANISVTIVLGYSSGRDGDLSFRVFAAMDKDQSWIKDEYRNNEILKHNRATLISRISSPGNSRRVLRTSVTPKAMLQNSATCTIGILS
jgi:hypothetical protein